MFVLMLTLVSYSKGRGGSGDGERAWLDTEPSWWDQPPGQGKLVRLGGTVEGSTLATGIPSIFRCGLVGFDQDHLF